MNADRFNPLIAEHLGAPLLSGGFRAVGRHYALERNDCILALLQLETKGSNLLQERQFVLCARHAYLRTLEKEPPSGFLESPNEYPFKIRPTSLGPEFLRSWRYMPLNLGRWESDKIRYGEPGDPTLVLSDIARRVTRYGPPWLEELSPRRILNELREYGENAYCERIWMEDYAARA